MGPGSRNPYFNKPSGWFWTQASLRTTDLRNSCLPFNSIFLKSARFSGALASKIWWTFISLTVSFVHQWYLDSLLCVTHSAWPQEMRPDLSLTSKFRVVAQKLKCGDGQDGSLQGIRAKIVRGLAWFWELGKVHRDDVEADTGKGGSGSRAHICLH